MKNKGAPAGAWSQPSPRAEMVAKVKALDGVARIQRLAIGFGKPDHIDDEVVVTLLLTAWRAGSQRDADSYASEVLRRATKHVRAHQRKNPGWQRLGGGAETINADFCQSIVLAILKDTAFPCHAEQAFGNYVYRRCLDEASKLYAKKHSAGQSLSDEGAVEPIAQRGDSADSLALSVSPEEQLIDLQEQLAEPELLESVRRIVQEDLPELPRIAFTFRFYGDLKIESKKEDAITVTSLMGVTEKTATKYINQAIELIKQGLKT